MKEKVVLTNVEAAPKVVKPLAAARARLMKPVRQAAAKKAKATRLSKQVNWKGEPRQRKAKRRPPEPVPRMVVHLRQRYTLGPRSYGPGAMTVTEDVGRALQEMEYRAGQEEARLHQDRAFVIGAGNRLMEVDPATFDMSMGGMLPHSQIRA